MQVTPATILMPIGYNILALGTISGLKGVLKLADLGYDVFQWCKKDRETLYLDDDLLVTASPAPRWKKAVRVIQGVLDTAHDGGIACLTTLLALSVFYVSKEFGQQRNPLT